jgi:TPR repeat protein
LGGLYENGRGVAQDYAQARRWYQKAADAGDAEAKQALARLPSE